MMRLLLFSLVLFAALSACVTTPIQVPTTKVLNGFPHYSGTLLGITEWRGDVVMAGDVRIPTGSRLVIHPGTKVYVRAAQGTKIDPEYISSATELLIHGELIISGSSLNPVTFIPVEVPADADYGWAGIELVGATHSRIVGAALRNAETGILCIGSSPILSENSLSNCRYGIVAQHQSDPKIIDNLIEDGEGGIFCWRASQPVIKGNQIVGHDEEGIHIDADSRPFFGRNVVRDNDIGIYLGSREIDFLKIEFSRNRINTQLSRALETMVDAL
jgi:parallel beta-helix repeat protein